MVELHLSQDAEADRLLSDDPLALLIGMVLDQQVPLEWAFAAPAELRRRLGGTLDVRSIARMDPGELAGSFSAKPALHRYPGSMAAHVQELCRVVVDQYGGEPTQVWSGATSGPDLLARIKALPGFGEQKAKIFVALLGKQLKVRPGGWKAVSAPFSDAGSFRSVADIVDDATLAHVPAFKQQMKATHAASQPGATKKTGAVAKAAATKSPGDAQRAGATKKTRTTQNAGTAKKGGGTKKATSTDGPGTAGRVPDGGTRRSSAVARRIDRRSLSSPGASALLAGRRLYLCTADRPDLASFVEACISGGVDLVQLRDKHLDAQPLVRRARLAGHVCRELGVPFILNDRPDLAVEAEADGVHIGQDDVSPAIARRIVGEHAIIGLSTHAPHELDAAAHTVADYLSVGPVEPTPTKPGRPGTGLGYVSFAARRARLPFFVTGGVTPEHIPDLADAGARRFVVVRYLTESTEPFAHAAKLRAVIDATVPDIDATTGPG